MVRAMSKSLKRVRAALDAAGITAEIVETPLARTAADAAAALDVAVDQIAKSIVFRGETSGEALLFLTAGGNRGDSARAASRVPGRAGAAAGHDRGGTGGIHCRLTRDKIFRTKNLGPRRSSADTRPKRTPENTCFIVTFQTTDR